MMLSRVAEYLYWMARYLERAENTARLINATTQVLLDLPRGASFGWDVLVKVAGLDSEFEKSYQEAGEANAVRFLIHDEANPSSIMSCIRLARENCRQLREVLPRQAWERINGLYLYIHNAGGVAALGRTQRYATLDQVIERLQSIIGLLSGCTPQDVGYHFLIIGRNVERADMTTRIVDINAAVLVPRQQVPEDPAISLLWMGVLKSLSAYQAYRREVSVRIRADDVVNYLLRDPHFPRTVHFCLGEVENCLGLLPQNGACLRFLRIAERRVERMRLTGLSPTLQHEYLDAVQADLAAVHDAISYEYFNRHDVPPETLKAAAAAG